MNHLLLWPHPALKKQAQQVVQFDEELKKTVLRLTEIMYFLNGAGLAAPQLGLMQNILVYRTNEQEGLLINPIITEVSTETQTITEGCLSFPDIFFDITRHKRVTVEFQNLEGKTEIETFEGLTAQVIQHEIDHLRGRTFYSYVSKLKQDITDRKMLKLNKKIKRIKQFNKTNQAPDLSIQGELV